MKIKIAVLLMAVIMIFCAFLTSCKSDGETEGTTAAQTENKLGPFDSFVNPNYPLMDLVSSDISQYVKTGDLSKLKIEHSVYVDDAVLDKKLNELAVKNGYYVSDGSLVTREGDTLNISFIGRMDGVAFEGGTSLSANITLSDNTGYIEGFDKDLYGISPGTTVFTTVTFPDDYRPEELRGKEAVFEITVKGIFGFNDKHVTEYTAGTYTSYAEFREKYRENLIVENLKKYENDIYTLAVESLEASAEVIKLPGAQVDAYFYIYYNDEVVYYQTYSKEFKEYYNILDFEGYRRYYGLTDEWLKAKAEVSVAEDLIMISAAKSMGIQLSNDEYDALIKALAEDWGYGSVDEFISYYGRDYLKLCVLKDAAAKKLLTVADIDSDYDDYKHLLDADTE